MPPAANQSNHAIENALGEAISTGGYKAFFINAVTQWGGFALVGYLFYVMITSELPAMRKADADRTAAIVKCINEMGQEVKSVIQTNSSAMDNLSKEVKLSREERQRQSNTKPNGNGQ